MVLKLFLFTFKKLHLILASYTSILYKHLIKASYTSLASYASFTMQFRSFYIQFLKRYYDSHMIFGTIRPFSVHLHYMTHIRSSESDVNWIKCTIPKWFQHALKWRSHFWTDRLNDGHKNYHSYIFVQHLLNFFGFLNKKKIRPFLYLIYSEHSDGLLNSFSLNLHWSNGLFFRKISTKRINWNFLIFQNIF